MVSGSPWRSNTIYRSNLYARVNAYLASYDILDVRIASNYAITAIFNFTM